MHNMLDLLFLDGMCHAKSMTPFRRAGRYGIYPYIILLFILFIGCSDTTPTADEDARSDKDLIVDKDNEVNDNSSDEQVDIRPDEDDEILDADNDSDIVCLDLRISENVIKTPFPFKDKDGKPTFCRPGCDTPTETDPQCVKNIWEWDNWEEYQVYLAAEKKDSNQTTERECYPWPCKMPDMKGYTEGLTSSCDRVLTAYGFSANPGAVWSHNMSGGIAGMELAHSGRFLEYYPEKDEFWTIGQAKGSYISNYGRHITRVYDRHPTVPEGESQKAFVISALRKNGQYYYELIYDNKEHNVVTSRPPFVGKGWVLIQVCDGENGSCEVKYAKVGVWEWRSLGVGAVYEGNIVGNHLTMMVPYTNPDRQVYYCDLSKYPTNYKECVKITRNIEGVQELGHSPRIDEDNENRVVYLLWKEVRDTLVEVIFDGDTPTYKDYTIPHTMQPNKLKGKYMMYTRSLEKSCWYRFDTQKTYCPEKPWSPYTSGAYMEFGIFSGKWQLWKTTVSTVIRDWECYCNEEGICPFEGTEPPKMDD